MAKQLGERVGISECFSDLTEMLRSDFSGCRSYYDSAAEPFFARQAMSRSPEAMFIWKNLSRITAEEAESLIQLAEDCGLKITAGHNYQFTLEMLEMRRLVKAGFLGGRPVHLESYWSYDLGDLRYASAFLGSRNHWVRQLPGQLFHNIISHGIAKLAEFLDDELTEIVATAYQSEQLRDLGAEEVLDELRVLIRDKCGITAFFCFSTQIKGLNQLRIYGPANSMIADIITGSLIRRGNRSYKSYLTYFIPPLKNAREHFRNARRNVANFARRRLYQDFGMKELIERFYNSIRKGSEPPNSLPGNHLNGPNYGRDLCSNLPRRSKAPEPSREPIASTV